MSEALWLPQIVLEKVLCHRTRQEEERKLAGSAWHETSMVFTTSIGTMLDARHMLREYYRLWVARSSPRFAFTICATRQRSS